MDKKKRRRNRKGAFSSVTARHRAQIGIGTVAIGVLALFLGSMGVWAAESRPAKPGPAETAALPPPDYFSEEVEALLPTVLTVEDGRRYKRIFALQEDGNWKEADELIAGIGNKLLMGHVLAQRYLHPTKYRAQYKELKTWMDQYADHPDAVRVHGMAIARQPAKTPPPASPIVSNPPTQPLSAEALANRAAGQAAPLGKAEKVEATELKRRVFWYLGKGWTKQARELLERADAKRLLGRTDFDRARAKLGQLYFSDGQDQEAIKWASMAASTSGKAIAESHWIAGLAAWRLEKYAEAQKNFEAVAVRRDISPWLISASAFWAARSAMAGKQPDRFASWMGVASAYPRTFYGMIARRVLDYPVAFDWSPVEEYPEIFADLIDAPAGRRALALVQIDETARAERELRALASSDDDPGLARGLIAMAERANMPALSMQLANEILVGAGIEAAAYPVPAWTPTNGFRVDRALVYALIRQESGFKPRAKSRSGARGLMQLMPKTAGYVANDRSLHKDPRGRLFEPEINLELGQKYVEMLLNDPNIKGDLFQLAAAWNGGPGNLQKWWGKIKHDNDPLLFIESIPFAETRDFIERVLSNLWIYRNRFGQPTPSLDAIAAGRWPMYVALDAQSVAADAHK